MSGRILNISAATDVLESIATSGKRYSMVLKIRSDLFRKLIVVGILYFLVLHQSL